MIRSNRRVSRSGDRTVLRAQTWRTHEKRNRTLTIHCLIVGCRGIPARRQQNRRNRKTQTVDVVAVSFAEIGDDITRYRRKLIPFERRKYLSEGNGVLVDTIRVVFADRCSQGRGEMIVRLVRIRNSWSNRGAAENSVCGGGIEIVHGQGQAVFGQKERTCILPSMRKTRPRPQGGGRESKLWWPAKRLRGNGRRAKVAVSSRSNVAAPRTEAVRKSSALE